MAASEFAVYAPGVYGWSLVGPGPRAYLCLALLPILDSITNQLQNAFGLDTGSLSMLQVQRGALAVFLTFAVLKYFYVIAALDLAALRAALVFVVSLVLWIVKEAFVTGTVTLENVARYVQILYWLEVWLLATLLFDTPAKRRFALACIVIAALICSTSIFYGYLAGAWTTYGEEGVVASAGLFGSGKLIAGQLVASGIVAAYLLRDRAGVLGGFIACILFGAAFLTYCRAGLVALGAALGVLAVWSMAMGRNLPATRWARRLLAWCLLAGVIGLVIVGTGDLATRWADVTDPDQAGSGRVVFWQIAVDSFWNGGFSDLLLGKGYTEMCDSIWLGYGRRIHTHSDVLDMLLVGGVLGIVFLLSVWIAMVARLRSVSVADAEYGAVMAVLASFFLHSVLTGSIFNSSAMSVYVITLVCFTARDSEEEIAPSQDWRLQG